MARKQNQIIDLGEHLQELLSDPVGNYDALEKAVSLQQDALGRAQEAIQNSMEWLTALQMALQANKIKALVRKAKENEA